MKERQIMLVYLSVIILLASTAIGHTFADELKGTTGGSLNALNSGYAITRWPWDGGDLLPGESATVRACTTDPPYPEATEVVFRWIRPDGSYWDVGPKVLALSGDTWNGSDIWDASDTQTIDMIGNWGVQALFLDEEGNLKGPSDPYPIVAIRAISYHVVPEVPLGAITAVLSMLGALGVFAIARRKTPIPKIL
ncbi:MAG: hypothetical protein NWE91_06365 [Candidatus Bathyarchaeota archaeon]|nr:hypothetical protein [Candidatus Bathyarchaeota archaeon]